MSVVPAAIDALVSICRNSTELVGVQVLDGPEARWPEQEFLAIGLSPDDLTLLSTRQSAGLASASETADLTCLIRAWTGDTDIRARRVRAYQILDVVQALIDADVSLGGACGHADIAGSVYAPSQGAQRGVVVDVVFTVLVRAF